MVTFLQERVCGQDSAIKALVSAVATKGAKVGGKALLVGPVGTGKTFLVEQLAESLFGADTADRFTRIDMTAFSTRETAKERFLGTEKRNGALPRAIDALNFKGGGILLFDDLQKAHSAAVSEICSLGKPGVKYADGVKRSLANIILVGTISTGSAGIGMSESAGRAINKVLGASPRYFGRPIVTVPLPWGDCLEAIERMIQAEVRYQSKKLGRDLGISRLDQIVAFFAAKLVPGVGLGRLRSDISFFAAQAVSRAQRKGSSFTLSFEGDRLVFH